MLNQRFKQAYAIAMQIPRRPDKEAKRRAILAWCAAAKKSIKG